MKNKLNLMSENHLKVNWTTIIWGLQGFCKVEGQLSAKDVINFAIDLVTHDDSQPNEVWQIASLSDNEVDEIFQLVQKMVGKENYHHDKEQRKWKAILLKKKLEELPQNYLDGLIDLTDFWEKFDFPANGPHIVQGRGNDISPTKYYTSENYLELIEAHKRWLSEELIALT